MGAGPDIVCVDDRSDAPAASGAKRLKPGFRTEDLVTCAPEVIAVSRSQSEIITRLARLPCVFVDTDSASMHDCYASIRALATVVDRETQAEASVLEMQRSFNDLKKRAALLPRKPKVLIEVAADPPLLGGGWLSDMIRFAGGMPHRQASTVSFALSAKEAAAFDPDMIVLAWQGADKALLAGRSDWSSLRAVLNGGVRILDHRLARGACVTAPEAANRIYGWLFEMLH